MLGVVDKVVVVDGIVCHVVDDLDAAYVLGKVVFNHYVVCAGVFLLSIGGVINVLFFHLKFVSSRCRLTLCLNLGFAVLMG